MQVPTELRNTPQKVMIPSAFSWSYIRVQRVAGAVLFNSSEIKKSKVL